MRGRGPEVSETAPASERGTAVLAPYSTGTFPGSALAVVGGGGREWLAWGCGDASGGF